MNCDQNVIQLNKKIQIQINVHFCKVKKIVYIIEEILGKKFWFSIWTHIKKYEILKLMFV